MEVNEFYSMEKSDQLRRQLSRILGIIQWVIIIGVSFLVSIDKFL
ncbi:MAG: hypothetical protein ABJO91_09675 [Ekhidna sp.]